jgi:hypothetical protein
MSLPRIVIRWLQNLDLTYSVRNPTRDFSNGFLIAEILERYYGSEVPLHSIHCATGLAIKEDNWAQISQIFARKNIGISQDTINDCINQRNRAAVSLVSELFQSLENIPICEPCPPKPTVDHGTERKIVSPHYAKATASFKVKDSNIERTVDDMERKLKRVQVIYDLKLENRSRSLSDVVVPVHAEIRSIPLDEVHSEEPMIPTMVNTIEALLVRTY